MLSILIPNYECNCVDLVTDLVKLGSDISVPWEIIVMDDGSSMKIRNQIRQLKNVHGVRYIELKKNVGRSKVRNALAEASQYDYLLFLDCDSKICRSGYLKKYESFMPNSEVLVGGRIYTDVQPPSPYILHWKYGRIREGDSDHFQSNNFLIPKQIFNQIRFDEKLSTYGHEDTLFGWHLNELGIAVHKIDNPVEHTGLETLNEFLLKQHSAGLNLINIQERHPEINTRLSKTAHRLKRHLMHYPIVFSFWILKKFQVPILNALPNLWLLDFFRIGSYLDAEGQKKKKAF